MKRMPEFDPSKWGGRGMVAQTEEQINATVERLKRQWQ
jgi:hypothetical protein